MELQVIFTTRPPAGCSAECPPGWPPPCKNLWKITVAGWPAGHLSDRPMFWWKSVGARDMRWSFYSNLLKKIYNVGNIISYSFLLLFALEDSTCIFKLFLSCRISFSSSFPMLIFFFYIYIWFYRFEYSNFWTSEYWVIYKPTVYWQCIVYSMMILWIIVTAYVLQGELQTSFCTDTLRPLSPREGYSRLANCFSNALMNEWMLKAWSSPRAFLYQFNDVLAYFMIDLQSTEIVTKVGSWWFYL